MLVTCGRQESGEQMSPATGLTGGGSERHAGEGPNTFLSPALFYTTYKKLGNVNRAQVHIWMG